MRAYYLDTSAMVKLVVEEDGSAALRTWVDVTDPDFVSCELLRIELLRTARRHSPEALAAARDRLNVVTLMPLSSALCIAAADLDPAVLRSLDALQLSAALSLGDDLAGVVTYDERLAAGCQAYGLAVVAPT